MNGLAPNGLGSEDYHGRGSIAAHEDYYPGSYDTHTHTPKLCNCDRKFEFGSSIVAKSFIILGEELVKPAA